jgi:hypothetical protein
MKPSELYARTPERVDYEIGNLIGFYYNHVLEIENNHLPWEDPNKRVEFRCYKYFNFDGRRFWRLAAVYFDGQPVMITQNAGREGDDHRKRFITDFPRYQNMVAYLMSLVRPEDWKNQDIVKPDDEIEGLDEFYGNKLDGHFERYR